MIGKIPRQTPTGTSRWANNSLWGSPPRCGVWWHRPRAQPHNQYGFLSPHGRSLTKGLRYNSRGGSYRSRPPVSLEGRETMQSVKRRPQRRLRSTWWPGNQRKCGSASRAGSTNPPPIVRQKQARCLLSPRCWEQWPVGWYPIVAKTQHCKGWVYTHPRHDLGYCLLKWTSLFLGVLARNWKWGISDWDMINLIIIFIISIDIIFVINWRASLPLSLRPFHRRTSSAPAEQRFTDFFSVSERGMT